MQELTVGYIAERVGARVIGDEQRVIGPDVVIDSRRVTPGALFVALVGERVDGHDFADQVVAAGAAAVMVTRELDVDIPQLIVSDAVAGLSALATAVVAQAREAGMVTIALTGSSGKTSTKDLIAQLLANQGATVAPQGSLNNEIGVPLTCCRVNNDTEFLVSEMGARGRGHVAWLTTIVPPDIALVLNVGIAHVGEFGSVEQTALAKGELIEGLSESGWAILNADDPRVAAMATRTKAKIGYFAVGDEPQLATDLLVSATDLVLDGDGRASFTLRMRVASQVSEEQITLDLIGAHHAGNAAGAAAVALAAGIAPADIAESLRQAKATSRWRMERTQRSDGVIVVNDAYNANPDSMAAAIAALHQIAAAQREINPQARAIAVLGDMRELGEDAPALHRELGALLQVDEVIAVGEHAAEIIAGAAQVGVAGRIAEKDEVAASLRLRPGDVVLLKASRGLAFETIAQQLLEGESA